MDDKIKSIADHYGYESRADMLIKEMAELTKAILKVRRIKQDIVNATNRSIITAMQNLYDEFADVEIMLEQVVYLLDADKEVGEVKQNKLTRQMERIGGAISKLGK